MEEQINNKMFLLFSNFGTKLSLFVNNLNIISIQANTILRANVFNVQVKRFASRSKLQRQERNMKKVLKKCLTFDRSCCSGLKHHKCTSSMSTGNI